MPAPAGTSLADEVALRDQCTVFLGGHGPVTAAGLLAGIPADTVPDPPQAPMMHLLLDTTRDGYAAAARRLAEEQGIWVWPQAMTTVDPRVQKVELSVGDATCALPPDRIRDIILALVAR